MLGHALPESFAKASVSNVKALLHALVQIITHSQARHNGRELGFQPYQCWCKVRGSTVNGFGASEAKSVLYPSSRNLICGECERPAWWMH